MPRHRTRSERLRDSIDKWMMTLTPVIGGLCIFIYVTFDRLRHDALLTVGGGLLALRGIVGKREVKQNEGQGHNDP